MAEDDSAASGSARTRPLPEPLRQSVGGGGGTQLSSVAATLTSRLRGSARPSPSSSDDSGADQDNPFGSTMRSMTDFMPDYVRLVAVCLKIVPPGSMWIAFNLKKVPS